MNDEFQYGERKAAAPVQQAFTSLVTFIVPGSVISQLHKWPGSGRSSSTFSASGPQLAERHRQDLR